MAHCGRPRWGRLIDRPEDWVRKEIEIGLATGRHVIPLLLAGGGVPSPHELPESIRDLPVRQAHRIREGYFRNDVDQLIGKIEYHVAPTWTPPVPLSPRPRRIPVKWPARLVVALSATLLLLPSVLTLTYADPYDRELLVPVFFFLYVSTLSTMTLLISHVPYLFRLKSVDREIQSWPIARFNRFTTLVALPFLMFGVVLAAAMTDNWRLVLPLTLGLSVAFFIYFLFLMMRQERREESELANWPQPLPSSLRNASFPADLRRTTHQLRDRVAKWREPLSREQRDKLRWVLAQLEQIVERLRACARRRRWRWLIDDHPWAACGYAVLMATTLGLFMAVQVPRAFDGRLTPGWYLDFAKFPLAVGIAGIGILEITYRHQRWLRELLADEVDNNLAELGEQLPQTAAAFADRTRRGRGAVGRQSNCE